jgi:hypothetical protein
MAKSVEELTDEQLENIVNNYERNNVSVGGPYSLRQVKLEQLRRINPAFPPRDVAKFIIERSNQSDDGFVTYLDIWKHFKPQEPWHGHKSLREIMNVLGAVVHFCVNNNLPVITSLVVRTNTRKQTENAVENMYEEAKKFGMNVGLVAADFVSQQQSESRQLDLVTLGV